MKKMWNKKIFYRVIGILGFLLISLNLTLNFLHIREYDSPISVILSFITVLCFFVIILFPHKIEFLALISFIISSCIIITEESNLMGIAMFHLGMITLYHRGFFIYHKTQKIITVLIYYICLIIAQFIFYRQYFFNNLINHIGMNLVLCLLEFFILSSPRRIKETNLILDIKKIKGLDKRDSEWLIMIQNHKTYKEIASTYNITEGTVRNRMNKVYKILEVGDKQGFRNLYSEYKISFGEAVSENNEEPPPMNQDEQQNLA